MQLTIITTNVRILRHRRTLARRNDAIVSAVGVAHCSVNLIANLPSKTLIGSEFKLFQIGLGEKFAGPEAYPAFASS